MAYKYTAGKNEQCNGERGGRLEVGVWQSLKMVVSSKTECLSWGVVAIDFSAKTCNLRLCTESYAE